MPSLLELVERINKGDLIDPALLEVYQESSNQVERFLSNHARAMLELRRSHGYLKQALGSIDYADQKVLFQFLSVLGFLGLSEQRAEPVIRFGAAAIARREVALGLEALQSGVVQDQQHEGYFTRDAENAAFVAEQYNNASQALGWFPPGNCDWNNPQLRIGYVTSSIGEDETAARLVLGLSKHLDAKDFKLHVYSTEAGARREKQAFTQGPFTPASTKRGKETIETLNRRKAAVWVAPLDQDLAGSARDLGSQIYRDQIDVLIIDTSFADPLAAVVANWQVSKAKINLVRRTPLLAGTTNAAIYLDANLRNAEASRWENQPVQFVQEGIEIIPLEGQAPQKSTYGLPEHSVILATNVDTGSSLSDEFLDAAVRILRQHSQAVLLVAGDADQESIKRRMESAGLGKRVGFAGKRKDLAEFLRIADVYLTPFDRANTFGTLAAMSAARAIVALAGDSEDPQRSGAILGDENVSADVDAYIDRAQNLLRNASERTQLGETMRERASTRFGFDQTARAIENLCRQIVPTQPGAQAIAA